MKDKGVDRPESEKCKNDHINQHIEVDDRGIVWQLCYGCDRKLFVRSK